MSVESREVRKQQECVLCRNHGVSIIKAGHKNCPYHGEHFTESGEICMKCETSKQKRRIGADEIKRKRSVEKSCSEEEDPQAYGKQRKSQKCRKCRYHSDFEVKMSGAHRVTCPFKSCDCAKCQDLNLLREAMKTENQVKRKNQKRQRNENTDSEINSSACSQTSSDGDPDYSQVLTRLFDINVGQSFKNSLP